MPRLLIFIVAYYAESTIADVLHRIPVEVGDDYDVEVLVIDDGSKDGTFAAALETASPFPLTVLHNPVNQGYGGNQKIGYHYAIERGFDLVALLHGDAQYAPERLPDLLLALRDSSADAVLGSRMMVPGTAIAGGMPLYKFFGNRILSWAQNRLLGTRLSEFHSGYRVYRTAALQRIPFQRNTADFHFDTEIIAQMVIAQQTLTEHPIPTFYGDEVCRVSGLRYAKNVIKACLQARLQKFCLFYDRRFDCAPSSWYPSKLEFDSTHSRVCRLVQSGARVLDLGCGGGAVGLELKAKKRCFVAGVDADNSPFGYDRFVPADLNQTIPDFDLAFDCVLALDVVEHINDPETFFDRLREQMAQWPGSVAIFTTGNIGFLPMRLSLLLGRFEYGKRGILDLTHRRLFTFNTFRRALDSAGFVVERMEGITPPLPFVFGRSWVGAGLMAVMQGLARLRPQLFGFQCLIVARPRPTLATLLEVAETTATEKRATLAVG